MITEKRTPIVYKREKSKVEISGDPRDVKFLIWIDLILSHLKSIIPVIILLCMVPKISIIDPKVKWLWKRRTFLILFAVLGDSVCLLFSG
jgi:hypothetical protein